MSDGYPMGLMRRQILRRVRTSMGGFAFEERGRRDEEVVQQCGSALKKEPAARIMTEGGDGSWTEGKECTRNGGARESGLCC